MDKIEVLYEDNSLVAVNKPAGLTVNISDNSKDNTLQNYVQDMKFILDVGSSSEEDADEEFVSRSGIVHRLDKATSGVLLISKTKEAFTNLQAQFKDRNVKKQYNAFVLGVLKDEIAEINAPIKRDTKNRMRMSLAVDGKPALTRVEKRGVFELEGLVATYVDIFPLTGRTHQIRVHMSALNHPVLGDNIYLTRREFEGMPRLVTRLMLHASQISFNHPVSGEFLTITAPLPNEFTTILNTEV